MAMVHTHKYKSSILGHLSHAAILRYSAKRDALFLRFSAYEINKAKSAIHGSTKVRWELYFSKRLKMLPILKHAMKSNCDKLDHILCTKFGYTNVSLKLKKSRFLVSRGWQKTSGIKTLMKFLVLLYLISSMTKSLNFTVDANHRNITNIHSI
jgi:hypothetical protein